MVDVKQKIKESKIIPELKEMLLNDCMLQFESKFGLSPSGEFEDISNLPNLASNPKEKEIRIELEKLIENKKISGISPQISVQEFTREYSYTYLNRFIALKLLEERKIILQTASKGYGSKGFIFYLADNTQDETLYNQGKAYEAYKNFFSWQCQQISKDEEIKILFNPRTTISKIFPIEKTLERIFELINKEELNEIWKEDEVIGWVYQYFIEDDKKRVFDKIYVKKQKMDLTDIAPATQIFTPKWIVKYLVENTLGRLWLRMHPDSKLRENLSYFVPNENDKENIEFKKATEITLLDPACGTMHFGMAAFDIFYNMYLEETENAGKQGWPLKPSIEIIEDISQSIIENNIYGIDIDQRSIQLSALSLYLKAKSLNKNASIQKYNLISTNIPIFTNSDIEDFTSSISSKYEITKKLLKLILPELNKAYYLGSLLKIEKTISDFLSKERKEIIEKFKSQLSLLTTDEERQLAFQEEVSWEEVNSELVEAIDEFLISGNGGRKSYLALESKKGISFINALIKRYDVVVTNPPYAGSRNLSSEISDILKILNPLNNNDLYSVFIQRSLELLNPDSFLGMVTQQSFMFTSSFKELRKDILRKTHIISLLQLGTNAFPGLAGAKINTCVFIFGKMKKISNLEIRGVYFNLTNEFGEEKRLFFEELLKRYKIKQKSEKFFIIPQEKLKQIPYWPFVYWISDKIRNLFNINKTLENYSKPAVGLQTGDNSKFLRLWWEVNIKNIFFDCINHNMAKESGKKWFPYMKGGEVNKWYGNQEYIVNWGNDGYEIKNFFKGSRLASRPQNTEYYFREGVTYSFLTENDMSVRYMPRGFIFDVAGSSIFPNITNVYLLLGILNSKISNYLINILNPTVNYQVGDLARLPYPDIEGKQELSNLIIGKVKKCIELKKHIIKTEETSWEFELPLNWYNGMINKLNIDKELTILESEISSAVYILYEIQKEDIEQIEKEYGKLPAELKPYHDCNSEELKKIKGLYLSKLIPKEILKQNEIFIEDENENSIEALSENKKGNARYLTFKEVCLASGYHPETVFSYIKNNNLERPEERYELAVRWISYAVGVYFGRFNVDEVTPDDDGIAVIDLGHNDDLPKNIEEVLIKVIGEEDTGETIKIIGGDLKKFLGNGFFIKHHVPMYKKRPVYWLLQTKNKNYSFYIYNQKITRDTLFKLIDKYIEPKEKLENLKLTELQNKAMKIEIGSEKREILKQIEKIDNFLQEIRDFKSNIMEIIDSGYQTDIDDGVILNMAPLYKVIPWKEPEKYYKELKEGKYQWSSISKIIFNNK